MSWAGKIDAIASRRARSIRNIYYNPLKISCPRLPTKWRARRSRWIARATSIPYSTANRETATSSCSSNGLIGRLDSRRSKALPIGSPDGCRLVETRSPATRRRCGRRYAALRSAESVRALAPTDVCEYVCVRSAGVAARIACLWEVVDTRPTRENDGARSNASYARPVNGHRTKWYIHLSRFSPARYGGTRLAECAAETRESKTVRPRPYLLKLATLSARCGRCMTLGNSGLACRWK